MHLDGLQELVSLQRRAATDGKDDAGAAATDGVDGDSESGGGGGAWATVGKKNKAATMRGEEDVQVGICISTNLRR